MNGVNELEEACTGLVHCFLSLAEWELGNGLEWWYTLGDGSGAVTVALVGAATGIEDWLVGDVAVRNGIPIGFGRPGEKYAGAAQLDPDDTLACIPLSSLPYLLAALKENDATNHIDRRRISLLRDRAMLVIDADTRMVELSQGPAFRRDAFSEGAVVN